MMLGAIDEGFTCQKLGNRCQLKTTKTVYSTIVCSKFVKHYMTELGDPFPMHDIYLVW